MGSNGGNGLRLSARNASFIISATTTLFGLLAWAYLTWEYTIDGPYYEKVAKRNGYDGSLSVLVFFIPTSVQRSLMLVESSFVFSGLILFIGVAYRVWILYLPYIIASLVRPPVFLVGGVACMSIGTIEMMEGEEDRRPELYRDYASFQFFSGVFTLTYALINAILLRIVIADYSNVRAMGLSARQKKFIEKMSNLAIKQN